MADEWGAKRIREQNGIRNENSPPPLSLFFPSRMLRVRTLSEFRSILRVHTVWSYFFLSLRLFSPFSFYSKNPFLSFFFWSNFDTLLGVLYSRNVCALNRGETEILKRHKGHWHALKGKAFSSTWKVIRNEPFGTPQTATRPKIFPLLSHLMFHEPENRCSSWLCSRLIFPYTSTRKNLFLWLLVIPSEWINLINYPPSPLLRILQP